MFLKTTVTQKGSTCRVMLLSSQLFIINLLLSANQQSHSREQTNGALDPGPSVTKLSLKLYLTMTSPQSLHRSVSGYSNYVEWWTELLHSQAL